MTEPVTHVEIPNPYKMPRWRTVLIIVTAISSILLIILAVRYVREEDAQDRARTLEIVERNCEQINEFRDKLIEAARPEPQLQAYLIATVSPLDCTP